MIYKKYGDTFRKIRKQKNISLSHFERLGISKSSLGKFERGEAMMGFDRVLIALQELGVSLEEFELYMNSYYLSDSDKILDNLFFACTRGQKEIVSKLSEIASDTIDDPIVRLIIKGILHKLSPDEKERITDYLYNVRFFGNTELCLLFHALGFLSSQEIAYLLDSLILKNKPLLNVPKYRDKFLTITYLALTLLSFSGKKDLVQYFVNCIEVQNLIHTLTNKNLKNFSKGFWIYLYENVEKGDELMLRSLEVTKNFSSTEAYDYYSKIYAMLTQKSKISKKELMNYLLL